MRNNMAAYTHFEDQSIQILDNIINAYGNGISLRGDIYNVFDSSGFVFVVKEGRLVCHFLQLFEDLADLYHNVSIKVHDEVPMELLFARFAWAVISMCCVYDERIPVTSPIKKPHATRSPRNGSQSSRSPSGSSIAEEDGL